MSQHTYAQQQKQEFTTVSLPHPGRDVGHKSVGIEAGVAAIVLAALCLSMTLVYAVASARCTKNGYTTQTLSRRLEEYAGAE